jgi:hypothetical protein
MEPRGCNRWQPVANWNGRKKGSHKPELLPCCDRLPQEMVRRGSTVRVRQRALQERRISAGFAVTDLHGLQRR